MGNSKIIQEWIYLKLIGEFMEPCTPYQNYHHLFTVETGLQKEKTQGSEPNKEKL